MQHLEGGWGTEIGTNPDAVKSQTWYIIKMANCPILWVSKLQSTTATSTMESEYTTLSMILRAFIPLQAVVQYVMNGLQQREEQIPITIKTTVHEENQGALILANLQPGCHTPWSKFYSLQLHCLGKQTSVIKIEFIKTCKQKADFLTKVLTSIPFQQNCALSTG